MSNNPNINVSNVFLSLYFGGPSFVTAGGFVLPLTSARFPEGPRRVYRNVLDDLSLRRHTRPERDAG